MSANSIAILLKRNLGYGQTTPGPTSQFYSSVLYFADLGRK